MQNLRFIVESKKSFGIQLFRLIRNDYFFVSNPQSLHLTQPSWTLLFPGHPMEEFTISTAWVIATMEKMPYSVFWLYWQQCHGAHRALRCPGWYSMFPTGHPKINSSRGFQLHSLVGVAYFWFFCVHFLGFCRNWSCIISLRLWT